MVGIITQKEKDELLSGIKLMRDAKLNSDELWCFPMNNSHLFDGEDTVHILTAIIMGTQDALVAHDEVETADEILNSIEAFILKGGARWA